MIWHQMPHDAYRSKLRCFPFPPFDIRSIPENISGEILKAVQSIYPMQNVYIRKVKALKKPKFDRKSI